MFSAYSPRAANAYQRINIETSMHTIDQHQLVSLLYEGVLNSIATARGAMARGDVLGKVNAISKALRIIEEGLSTALDRVDGGELASNLHAAPDPGQRPQRRRDDAGSHEADRARRARVERDQEERRAGRRCATVRLWPACAGGGLKHVTYAD